MAGEKEETPQIDTNLYSRQIGAFGMEAMGKLMQMRVLITGLNGIGVECAKNLILAGPRSVGLHDPRPARGRDLGSVFTFGASAVSKGLSRAAASVTYLAALNQYVHVEEEKDVTITEQTLKQYDALVVCEGNLSEAVRLNTLCRTMSPPLGFVFGICSGLCLSLFTDFGDTFHVFDTNGEDCKETLVAAISSDARAVVSVHPDKPLPFQDGDYVTFREVEGMTELNSLPPQKIKLLGRHSFEIGDTRSFSAYTSGGIVKQVKQGVDVSFRSLKESIRQPVPKNESFLVVADLAKFDIPSQLHFCFMALLSLLEERAGEPVPHAVLYSETARASNPAAAAAAKEAADACVARGVELAESLLKECRELEQQKTEAVITVESINKKLIEHIIRFSGCCLSPIASFMGGVMAQEVVKLTGKYTPLRGFLYLDALECLLNAEQQEELKRQQQDNPVFQQQLQQLQQEIVALPSLLDFRYADQVAVFGEAFQVSLFNSNVFLVGAGALGCELLKGLALLGVSAASHSATGGITITDMDRIEVSNLNRQFLFRREHVGKSKSTTAAQAALKMNPHAKIEALEARVGVETENTVFTETFWRKQDIIVNALDNIQARQYVDSRCVVFSKPLLESGTLGTKANVQVVIPHMTQCYSDSMDPPEESIPLCTLRHFPHLIEHTIEWGRDMFQGVFGDKISEARQFVADPKAFIEQLQAECSVGQQLTRLEGVRETLSVCMANDGQVVSTPSFAACVKLAVCLFVELFNIQINCLLAAFPKDHRTAAGLLFWAPPKRPPTPIQFSATEHLHMQFVLAAANLYAEAFGVPQVRDMEAVQRLAAEVKPPEFVEKRMQIKLEDTEDDSGSSQQQQRGLQADVQQSEEEEKQRIEELKKQLLAIQNTSQVSFHPAEFSKDAVDNFHVDFVHYCAMLRAENYAIPKCDRHKTLMVAGRIVPAVATTTAMVTGLVTLEFLKLLPKPLNNATIKPLEGNSSITGKKTTFKSIEDFKNAFINLALPLWIFSEPMPPIRNVDKDFEPVAGGPVRAVPQGFTCWDRVEVDIPGCRVEDLIKYLEDTFNVNVDILSFGNFCLFNNFLPNHKQKRLRMPVAQLVEEVTKRPAPSVLLIESSCNSKLDAVDVLIPTIAIANNSKPQA